MGPWLASSRAGGRASFDSFADLDRHFELLRLRREVMPVRF